jgi:hypothetical protein
LACTVMAAVPERLASWVLVAVMVTLAAVPGAVNRPLALMAPPPVTDHVTAELKLPVPCTFALHCEVAEGATVAGEQLAVTEETEGDTVCGGVLL